MRTTFTYLLSSLLALCLLHSCPIQAQGEKKEPKKEESAEPKHPLFQGLTLGVDLFGAGSYLLGDDFLSTEVALTANLGYKFYPVVEIGFGKTDTNNDKGIHYKTAAPYFRLGVDYNVTAKKRSDSHFYVGARYGF